MGGVSKGGWPQPLKMAQNLSALKVAGPSAGGALSVYEIIVNDCGYLKFAQRCGQTPQKRQITLITLGWACWLKAAPLW
jgi:hypothetical protein